MTSGKTLVRAFLEIQGLRFQLRWLVVRTGLYSALFWMPAILGATWLEILGLNAVNYALFALWMLLAGPILFVQLSLILDLVGYVFTGKIHFFPMLQAYGEAQTDGERRQILSDLTTPELFTKYDTARPVTGLQRLIEVLVPIVSATSPLACFSTWAVIVLARIPATNHARRTSARAIVELRRETEIQVYETAVARLRVS
jgi:hypothetical protein